tara:strand:+ start:59 stop:214 length:156 start_codon:yes stop_codon:yes gene_type:complete
MTMAFDQEILIEAMKNSSGNITRTTETLATTQRILAYRLKKHGLHEELTRK